MYVAKCFALLVFDDHHRLKNYGGIGNVFVFAFCLVSLVRCENSNSNFVVDSSLVNTNADPSTVVCTGDCLSPALTQQLKDTCPDIQDTIQRNVYPRGNTMAGKYEEVKDVNSTEPCVIKCCESPSCDYAFMVNQTCFLLSCVFGSGPCQPTKIPEDQEASKMNVSMSLVRTPKQIPVVACEFGVPGQCGANAICRQVQDKSRNGLCLCQDGFSPTSSGCEAIQDKSKALLVPSTPKTIRVLDVSVLSQNVTLPINEAQLHAIASPPAPEEHPYTFEWALISHPTEDTATIEGQRTSDLHLTGLKQGLYIFQVNVKNPDAIGSANATVNVAAEKRLNHAPIAVITPPVIVIQMPTRSVVLDASSSMDDDKIVSYKWELQKSPIGFALNPALSLNLTTLQIEELTPGNYTIKLTVEDSEQASNFTTANITVIKETDYPPTAIAGNDIVVYLPQSELILNGNGSTDDKKITQWEWKATSDMNRAVDMQDTHTPYLKLSHLQEGVYQFELRVSDDAGQSSTSTVHVFVKKPSGNPPTADAGITQTIALPQTWAALDSSGSKSDSKIVKWQWTQHAGPTNATILNADQQQANATGLTKGDYEFQVEIEDEAKLSAKSVVKVVVMQKINEPPKANAGKDVIVTLPQSIVILNGSTSTDDVKITEWKWERQPESLAAGVILGISNLSPLLMLTDLVPGNYSFKLTVKDEQGLSDEDTVLLTVKQDVHKRDLVEIIVGTPISLLTQSDVDKLIQQMTLLLHDTRLQFNYLRSQLHTEFAVIVLHAVEEKDETMDGSQLAAQIRQRLRQDDGLIQFPIVTIDTVECLDSCSGHGRCQDTAEGRQCLCDAFWMENFLKKKFGGVDRNCEWSKIYVGVVSCLLLMMLSALLWSLMFLFRRNMSSFKDSLSRSSSSGSSNGSTRSSKRHHAHKKQLQQQQYTLLDDEEMEMESKDEGEDETEDSDSDILFETKRNRKNGLSKKSTSGANGASRNGILKYSRRIKA